MSELVIMAEAKQKEAWNHTATLMALCVNMMRDPRKKGPVKPEDFHPFMQQKKIPVLKGKELQILKDVFVKDK